MKAGAATRLGFELWLFLVVAFAGTTLLWTQPALRLAALLIFALPVLAWAITRVRGPLELLDMAILVGIVAHLVVSLASLDREGSLESSAIVVVYAAAYWLARHVGGKPALRRTAAIAVVMALTAWLALIGFTWVAEKIADIQAFGWPPRLDAHQPYVWGSVNTPPVLLLLAAPFVAWLPERGIRRGFTAGLTAIALIVIPFSVGRAAWLGIAAAVLALAWMAVRPRLARDRRLRWVSLATIGSGAALATWLVITRFDALAVGLDSRVRLWQQAWGLFVNDPMTGSGPGTFSWARLAYVPDFTDRVGASAAHNVLMQTLAEGGLLLAASLTFIAAAWVWQLVTARGSLGGPQRMAYAVLTGFAAFSLLDDFSFLPSVTVIVIILAAWSLPPRPCAATTTLAWRHLLAPAVLGMVAVVAAPAAISLGVARIGLAEAREAAVNGDWNAALTGFRAAAAAQPAGALHWMSIGLAEHHLERSEEAVEAFRAAQRANPGDPRPWGALAALAGENDEIDLLREAARRSNDPQYAYRLATALAAQGQAEEAAEYFAIASVIQPQLYAALPEPMRSSVRPRLAPAIGRVGSVEGRDPREVAWNAALDVDEVDLGAPVQWHIARLVDARNAATAADLLAGAEAQEPRYVRTWQAAAALATLKCDRPAVERAETNIDRLGGEAVDLAEHRIVDGRPGIYHEPDLGDYQPLGEPSLPSIPPWPFGLIQVPDCGW